jgi:hypothetical protein
MAAEFGDRALPAHFAAQAVKTRVPYALEARAAAQGLAVPPVAAKRVFLLLEGVWADTRMFGRDAPLDQAKDAVRRLIG